MTGRKRLRLNVFSPLPPVRSEIANFTLRIIGALRELADVTVWTAQNEPPAPIDPVKLQIFDPANVPFPLLQQADLNIYNLGNNATFHRTIFDVARKVPGLIVLHDTRLQHFFARYSENEGADRDFYLESMRRSHGLAGLAGAKGFLAGTLKLDALVDLYPMTLAALDGALAAVMHNGADRDALAAQTRTPVFHLPLAFAGPGPAARSAPNGTLRLIVFGFIGFNRRLGSILEALAGHADTRIQLDIYGAIEDDFAIVEQAAALGLADRVLQHGFVPEAELEAALGRADLALNLRFPSMGEASSSQLRIWDSALPSLVTRTGWYATLPDDAVFFVEPDDEAASIQAHLTALRQDPERFRRAGLRGREVLLQRHSPEDYARGLVAIAGQAAAFHGRRQAIALSRRATHVLLDMTDLAGIGQCAGPVADAVHALTQPGK